MSYDYSTLWIAWETQRRNESLAAEFEASLHVFDYAHMHSLLRYPLSTLKTLKLLVLKKPTRVFAPCPSLVLVSVLAFLKPLFNYVFVIDAHNIAVRNYHGSGLRRVLARYAMSKANMVIVSNSELAKGISNSTVLPDPLPQMHAATKKPSALSPSKKNVLFISSFSFDEPIKEFLEVAKSLENQFQFFITGSKKKAGDLLSYESENIVFTGFLSQEAYDTYLSHADLAIDLSTDDNCLVCGAYEALAVGTPCIISDSKASREVFTKGFVYTDNTKGGLEKSLLGAEASLERLRDEMPEAKSCFQSEWSKQFNSLKEIIYSNIA